MQNPPKKEFDLKSAIEYLEFWKPIDGTSKLMVLWSEMGPLRIKKVIVKMGYDISKVDYKTSLNIIKKSFGAAGIVGTRRILLETLKAELDSND